MVAAAAADSCQLEPDSLVAGLRLGAGLALADSWGVKVPEALLWAPAWEVALAPAGLSPGHAGPGRLSSPEEFLKSWRLRSPGLLESLPGYWGAVL